MSSTGSGYDYSCGTFSPDGHIFQTEYAQKAVALHGTAIGIKCNDGILLAVEKPQSSKLLVPGSNRRVFGADTHVGVATTGVSADGRQLVNRTREEASNFESTYGSPVVPSVLANRISLFMHYFTIHGALRPFGAAALMAAYDQDMKKAELYMVEPSGDCVRYFACAAGKGAQAARTELEKILTKRNETGITCAEAIDETARILHTIRDPNKDKPFELEMGWLTEANDHKWALVPDDVVKAADAKAKEALEGSAAAGAEAEGGAAMETE